MADVFGYTPQKATLILSPGADFIHTITPTSGTFPAGMTAAIKLYARGSDTVLATWAGTVTSGQITWTIQSNTATTGVDAMYAAGAAKFRLYITFDTDPGGTTLDQDFLWYYGTVQWRK
ncbi:hypothetical protein SEA_ZIKO_60 [Gordonia phage Ziko]|uniref:LtfC/p132/Gp6 beta-sandwich domain-containing protein n=2 Tax=Ronaldovirus ronaldo TaxID=2734270 RepID=A0A6B9LGI0_9CAUD|nr:hypothetical protein SEA_ZIKO_60 [Gordonia phage Ziko]QHB38175.1 hypothetical protein SEA_VOLT_59 [Gordonia phage Volt]